jgi:hypothetical protein
VGPAYQKTCRPVSGPNRPSWQPTRPLEDLPKDFPDDLIHHDLKTWRTRQDLSGFRPRQIDGIWQDVYVDLGLLVVTGQESGNRPHPLTDIRRARRPLVQHAQSSSITNRRTGRRVLLSEGPTIINSQCPLCSAYSSATFEFLALDSTPLNN